MGVKKTPSRAQLLVRSADPGILPCYRYVLVVSAESYVRTIAVAKFQALVRTQRDRGSRSNTGAGLKRANVFYSISASATAVPEIAVEREPEPLLFQPVT